MMEVLRRMDLRNEILIKLHKNFLRLAVIRFLILDPKREGVGTHKMTSLHVSSVERVILVNAWLEQEIALVVSRVTTRLEISLT